jgi:hypothetical protein
MQTIVVKHPILAMDAQGRNHELMPGTHQIDKDGNLLGTDAPLKITNLKEAVDNGHVEIGEGSGVSERAIPDS